jgi:hypothetical protein
MLPTFVLLSAVSSAADRVLFHAGRILAIPQRSVFTGKWRFSSG